MNLTVIIFSLISIVITLSHVDATFDWSNLDLINFQYFKERPTTTQKPILFYRNGHLFSIRRIPEPLNKFQKTVSQIKAVGKYLKGVAFGTDEEKIKVFHPFDPFKAEKLSETYQEKYGKHGEKLVQFLGDGPSHENLIRAGAI